MDMYEIKRVLNHNTIMVVRDNDEAELLMMGKGIGFGKKTGEKIAVQENVTVYSLQECTDRGDAKEIVSVVSPICLELANEVLKRAEEEFGQIDKTVLFPMADHIEYAVQRIKNNEQISNPLTDDIRILFHMEYKVAQSIQPLLFEELGVNIDEHEIGYIALHVHSAIKDEKVSQAMQIANAVRQCISLLEEQTGKEIDVMSLAYNRLMNHIRNMVARTLADEKLKLNMNDYMEVKFPDSFKVAKQVCDEVGHSLRHTLDDVEIGYLAMHIERIANDEM